MSTNSRIRAASVVFDWKATTQTGVTMDTKEVAVLMMIALLTREDIAIHKAKHLALELAIDLLDYLDEELEDDTYADELRT